MTNMYDEMINVSIQTGQMEECESVLIGSDV